MTIWSLCLGRMTAQVTLLLSPILGLERVTAGASIGPLTAFSSQTATVRRAAGCEQVAAVRRETQVPRHHLGSEDTKSSGLFPLAWFPRHRRAGFSWVRSKPPAWFRRRRVSAG